MDEHLPLGNRVKELRSLYKLSQHELARAVEVTRQTIGGIETGQYSPSATVAMRIARALESKVEDVFWLREMTTIAATPIGECSRDRPTRAALAKVGDRWIAHSLYGTCDMPILPADGLVTRQDGDSATVHLLDDEEALSNSVSVAGCAPALELWSRTIERGQSLLRSHVVSANSTRSLEMLRRGEVHLAGIHFGDGADGRRASNHVAASAALAGHSGGMMSMGAWCEGLLVAKGNPKNIRSIADVAQSSMRFVNREAGAGSRKLFDSQLAVSGIPTSAIGDYNFEVHSPTAIARAIACDTADVGIGVESVAFSYGLDFIPLELVRYDIVFLEKYLAPSATRFLDTLTSKRVRTQFLNIGCSEIQPLGVATKIA